MLPAPWIRHGITITNPSPSDARFSFCQDAIGWHVAVLSEENAPDGSEQEKYFTGAKR